MPKPNDYLDSRKRLRREAYRMALQSWKEVARLIIEADKSNHFWARKSA
jgi:hypothetical protein